MAAGNCRACAWPDLQISSWRSRSELALPVIEAFTCLLNGQPPLSCLSLMVQVHVVMIVHELITHVVLLIEVTLHCE